MTEKDTEKTRWKTEAFEKFKAAWTPARIAEDEKILSEVFQLAATSPLLAEELTWARDHGIQFFVDHQVQQAYGYYVPGMGVMAMSLHAAQQPETALLTLAHELRHAWQDYYGLNNTFSYSFSENAIRSALIEADAQAFGLRALDQHRGVVVDDEAADLRAKFLSWYSSEYPALYGAANSEMYARNYSIDLPRPIKPELAAAESAAEDDEFNPDFRARGTGVDIGNIKDVLRLGVNFAGTKNYLAGLPPDILPKKLLSPALANTFWGAATAEQRAVTTALRKSYLKIRNNMSKDRKPHPWP